MKILNAALLLMVAASTSVAQDMGKQVFQDNMSITQYQHQRNNLSSELLNELENGQVGFVENFCALCGCCTVGEDSVVKWDSDMDNDALNAAGISIVPKMQFDIFKDSIKKAEATTVNSVSGDSHLSPTVTDLDAIISMIGAKHEYCTTCNCCNEQFGFDPKRASEEGLESPIADTQGDSNQQVYVMPRWMILNGLGRQLE